MAAQREPQDEKAALHFVFSPRRAAADQFQHAQTEINSRAPLSLARKHGTETMAAPLLDAAASSEPKTRSYSGCYSCRAIKKKCTRPPWVPT